MNHYTAVQRFFRLLQPDRKDILYIYLYALFAGILALSLPLGIQAVLGLIAGGQMSSALVILILATTLGTLFSGLLKVMQMTVTENIQRRLFSRSSFEFAVRLPRLRLDQLVGDYPPELANRFFDTLTLQKGVPKLLMDASTSVLQILFGLLLISFYHPFFVFFGLILLVLLVVTFRITGPRGMASSLQESKYKYQVAHWLQELTRALPTFKMATFSRLPLERTNQLVNNYLDARGRHFQVLLTQYGAVVGFKTVVTGVLMIIGGLLAIDNQISLGQFVAAEIVVLLILNSVEKLILTIEVVYDVLTALEKIGHVTDMSLDDEAGLDYATVDTGRGIQVEVRDLHFQFSDSERLTLEDVSFSIREGEKVVIAGTNGSGKATLVQIVAGLLLGYQGAVIYNGVPARNFNIASMRRYVGDYGAQEDIFRGTLLENLSLAQTEADFGRLVKAVEQVGLTAYVQSLPQGYATDLLPGGRNLPQHARTKIILARALLKQPRLLALGEFLSQLTNEDRPQVIDLLTSPEQPWTLLAVSNDPLFAAKADRVLLMDKGRIVGQGSYRDIKDNPYFHRIFEMPLTIK